jgi:hypothetical protein
MLAKQVIVNPGGNGAQPGSVLICLVCVLIINWAAHAKDSKFKVVMAENSNTPHDIGSIRILNLSPKVRASYGLMSEMVSPSSGALR